jgi:hypothetical protein
MADLQIGDELSEALHTLAATENLSVEVLLSTLVERYQSEKNSEAFVEATGTQGWRKEALDSFVGMFADDITDLSE